MKKFKMMALMAVFGLMAAVTLVRASEKVDVQSLATNKELIDINSASKEQLMSLPGIGDKLATAIIAGRPYKKKTDLTAKKIINSSTYKVIAPAIIAHQS